LGLNELTITIQFDDFYDTSDIDGFVVDVTTPDSPFQYRGFTFDPTWSFVFCENVIGERNQTCNPKTKEGKYYIALYSSLNKDYVSRLSRRITYDLKNDTTSWEVLSYSLSAFPKPGQTITVLMCAWNIYDQDDDIRPSFCRTEYFTAGGQNNVLRPIVIDNGKQELAFIEFTGYDGYYSVGAEMIRTTDKGLQPAEFFIEDLAVCVMPQM
jgi:hypothetical protein